MVVALILLCQPVRDSEDKEEDKELDLGTLEEAEAPPPLTVTSRVTLLHHSAFPRKLNPIPPNAQPGNVLAVFVYVGRYYDGSGSQVQPVAGIGAQAQWPLPIFWLPPSPPPYP